MTLAACDKRESKPAVKEQDNGIGADNARLEQTFNDVQKIVESAANGSDLSTLRTTESVPLAGCATITFDSTVTPRTLTIDFGNTNCLCNDNRYRRGKIIVSYTGRYKDSAYTHTVNFINYFVNDNQVVGTKTLTNMGKDGAGRVYYNININGGIILAAGNGTLSWTSNRTRTWTAGYNTIGFFDDAYEIAGSAVITRPNGNTVNASITSPLEVANNCNWIRAGALQITPQSGTSRTVDFGNGACDGSATVTIAGTTYPLTLP